MDQTKKEIGIDEEPKKIGILRKYYKDNEYIIELDIPSSVLPDHLELVQFPTCLFVGGPGLGPCEIPFYVETDLGDEKFDSDYSEGVLTLKFATSRGGKPRPLKPTSKPKISKTSASKTWAGMSLSRKPTPGKLGGKSSGFKPVSTKHPKTSTSKPSRTSR